MSQIQTGFVVDGQVFQTRALATAYLQRPAQLAALKAVTGNDVDLSNWLIDNKTAISDAFEAAKVKRVTKSEKNQLEKALNAVVEAASTNKHFLFIAENHKAILESFRWPSVKRGDESEQEATIRQAFIDLIGEDNLPLVDWVISNKEPILIALAAGEPKREVSPKATEALAAYRAKKAAEKAEKEAAEKATAADDVVQDGGEAVESAE